MNNPLEPGDGHGSTFFFTVRLGKADKLPADTRPPDVIAGVHATPLHILLAEDNLANQKLARYVLQDRGHTVDWASNGQEAIRLEAQRRYQVILMDVQMPDMDGLEATAAIRKRAGSGPHVPIIALTAHAMEGDRERCLAAGMDAYLSKPIDAGEMIRLVEQLASGISPAPPPPAEEISALEQPPAEATKVFDQAEALTRCFNSRKVMREMAEYFIGEVDDIFGQMESAVEQDDLTKVGKLGHRLAGTLVYLGARPATAAALRVEQFCKSNDGTRADAEEAIRNLRQACELLRTTLAQQAL